MSARQQERLVLAASALVALGRDDRLQAEGYAERAIKIADAMIAQLDATAPEEDSDEDEHTDAINNAHEQGYETGVRDTERRVQRDTEARLEAVKLDGYALGVKETEERHAREAAAKQTQQKTK